MRKFFFILGAIAFGCLSPCYAETTSTLLKEAITLTAQQKLPEAEAKYKELAEGYPEVGFPALARFLSRTGRTSDAATLLEEPRLRELSPLSQARTAVAASLTSEAISILRAPAAPGEEYQQALLLSNQMQKMGQTEAAADALVQAVQFANLTAMERRDLYQKLTRFALPEKLAQTLPEIVSTLMKERELTYPQLRELVNEAMLMLSQFENYADFQRQIDRDKDQSPAHGWIYSMAAIRRGEPELARSQIETLTTSALSMPERLIIDEELATMVGNDPMRQIDIYEKLLPHALDHERIRVTLSQMLFRQKRYDKISELLKDVDPERLDPARLQIFKNVKLAISGQRSPSEIIEAFETEVKGLPYDRLREVAQAPLVSLQADSLDALRQLLNTRLNNEQTSAPSELYILLMSVENLLGNEEGTADALRRYVMANPQNIEAASELADALSQRAYEVATADPTTSPSMEELEYAANSAAEALWSMIEMRPYVPEPYEKLIAIYKLYGQPEKARQVTNYLTDNPNATAEEIHLAAYVMATNDLPEEAVPVYERALKLRPDHTLFRLNYAGALSRVGRLKEADEIYRDIIKNGVNGRQYHAHEVYANGVLLARTHGYLDDFLAFLREQIPNQDLPQHDYFLVEIAKVLSALNMEEQALLFLNALQVQYPDKAWEAREHMVTAYLGLKQFDKADQVLVEAEQESTDTLGRIMARNNRAVVRAEQGRLDEAIEIWRALAEEHPRDRTAARGLLIAAQRLVEGGRFSAANGLLARFLALDTGDSDAEIQARELLARVKSLDVPSSTIVQSAILEAADDVSHAEQPARSGQPAQPSLPTPVMPATQ